MLKRLVLDAELLFAKRLEPVLLLFGNRLVPVLPPKPVFVPVLPDVPVPLVGPKEKGVLLCVLFICWPNVELVAVGPKLNCGFCWLFWFCPKVELVLLNRLLPVPPVCPVFVLLPPNEKPPEGVEF